MISFWISMAPPKIGWTWLSRQSSQSWRRTADYRSAGHGGLYLIIASRGGLRCV